MRKPVVDGGVLRLGYWEGNDVLQVHVLLSFGQALTCVEQGKPPVSL